MPRQVDARAWEERLRREGLGDPDDPRYNEARKVFRRAHRLDYYEAATDFLHDHTFADDYERMLWQLHLEGLANREIVRRLRQVRAPGAYRKRVDLTIGRLRKLMMGRMSRRGRRGNRPDVEQEGLWRGCVRVVVRLATRDARALFRLMEKLAARGTRMGKAEAMRAALLAFERSLG